MLQTASVPIAAKICAALCLTSGAGVATYQLATPEKEPTVEAAPAETLAFRDDNSVEAPESANGLTSIGTTKPNAEEPKPPEEKEEPEGKPEEIKAPEEEKAPEVEADTEAPEIVILSPKADSHHDEKKVVFEGETEPGAKVAAGPYAATVNDDGHWRIELILSPGANKATISATDAAGNIGYATITVWLDDEEVKDDKPDEKKDDDKTEPVNVAFTANQQYGSCDAAKPYDVFWGTATPNTKVTITSPYGSATVEVNEKGHWEKKVYFETAPTGETFTITVTGANGSQSFSFVSLAPEADEEPEKPDGHETEHGDETK